MPGEAETAAAQLRKQLAEHEAAAAAAGAANSEAQSQLAAWQGKSAELATARASLQQLEDRMFVGPACGRWRRRQQRWGRGGRLAMLAMQGAGQCCRSADGIGGDWQQEAERVAGVFLCAPLPAVCGWEFTGTIA